MFLGWMMSCPASPLLLVHNHFVPFLEEGLFVVTEFPVTLVEFGKEGRRLFVENEDLLDIVTETVEQTNGQSLPR
jgi:hypothetical protein